MRFYWLLFPNIYCIIYFISILIQKFWFDFWNSFVCQNHISKKNPFCTDSFILLMQVLFCNCHRGGQLTTTHCIFDIFSYVCLSTHFDEYVNNIIVCSLVGFRVSVKNIFYKACFDDQHMRLNFVIWSLMVLDEIKDNVVFRWT